jgi:hypothetical protein
MAWARLERLGIVLVLALIALPSLLRYQGVDFDPLGNTLLPAVGWAYDTILHVAGVRDVG